MLKQPPKSLAKPLPFIDLQAQQAHIRPALDAAIARVLDHGKYIMGPEVFELEAQLSEYCDVQHCVTCSSGTDALLMVLMAKGIGPGDAVFIPSFTFTATPEVVALLGATPIFVDVQADTFNIDPASVQQGIDVARSRGLTAKAIIAVDLYGQPADYPALESVAQAHNLWILADAAQSFGGTLRGKKVGSLALVTATSFFPAKPLGCYGDGGAIFTEDAALAETLRSIRVHGKGEHKYDNVRIGLNARLDTLQAAILIEKLRIFDDELTLRDNIAKQYNQQLEDRVQVPKMASEATSAWAQYTVTLPNAWNREAIMKQLKSLGVPSVIYYGKPLHLQTAYQNFPRAGELSVSESLAQRVLSLPMHSQLCQDDWLKIAADHWHTLG